MEGLSTLNQDLQKESGEGSMENNLKQLITDEAFTQISSKFPKLTSMIVGVEVMDQIDDKTALAAAVISSGSSKAIIPIVYSNGRVDATTFIYSEEQDSMLALTRKIVALLMQVGGTMDGSIMREDSKNVSMDTGDINQLFIPPRTYSPKIASGGSILIHALESDSLLKESMIKSLKNNEVRAELSSIYGNEMIEYIDNITMEKTASVKDNSAAEAIFSIEKLSSSNWENMRVAIDEFSKNGFVISHGDDTQSLSLEKLSSVEDEVKKITGDEAVEGISKNSLGVFTIFDSASLSPYEIVKATSISGEKSPMIMCGSSKIDTLSISADDYLVGKQKRTSDSTSLSLFNIGKLSNEGLAVSLIFLDGDAIKYGTHLSRKSIDIQNGLSTILIKGFFGKDINEISISKGKGDAPIIVGSTLYIGENNIRVVERGTKENTVTPLTMSMLHAPVERDIVKVAFDGVEYVMNNGAYSRNSLVDKLISDGFDKGSIYSLVKTAKATGNAELAVVGAKLDMLANLVMNLAGKVQEQSTMTQSLGLGGVPTMPQLEQPDIANEAQSEGMPQPIGTAMPDPHDGMPSLEQEAAAQQQQAQDISQDQSMLQQQPQIGQEQGMQPQPEQDQGQQVPEGMNQALDPNILKALAQVKDSKIMDVSVLAMLAQNSDIGDVIADYSADIIKGASAIGKILLNMMVSQNDTIEKIGEKKYATTVKSLKTVFFRISDLYADIVKMEISPDGKMDR